MSYFYNPWKLQKTTGFLTFSVSIEIGHWLEINFIPSESLLLETVLFNKLSIKILSSWHEDFVFPYFFGRYQQNLDTGLQIIWRLMPLG